MVCTSTCTYMYMCVCNPFISLCVHILGTCFVSDSGHLFPYYSSVCVDVVVLVTNVYTSVV